MLVEMPFVTSSFLGFFMLLFGSYPELNTGAVLSDSYDQDTDHYVLFLRLLHQLVTIFRLSTGDQSQIPLQHLRLYLVCIWMFNKHH